MEIKNEEIKAAADAIQEYFQVLEADGAVIFDAVNYNDCEFLAEKVLKAIEKLRQDEGFRRLQDEKYLPDY